MKLLLDQGLPRSTAELLRGDGHDAVHVGEVGMAAADDTEILSTGLVQGRVVVTLDADFHALLALSGRAAPSVLRIRVEGLRAAAMASLIHSALRACGDDLARGAIATADLSRVRVRRIPL